jgi:peptidyl-prolyl cis-trans isomerase SDCCAG10
MSLGIVAEPQTRGKVILVTSLGELEIELWSKEAPKACRNFIQLALEGYYNNCVFHRIIKDFIAQTGDKTGGGNGGESIYGDKFHDEHHSRLKFTRRGIMACAGGDNKNDSQFFITLDKTESLNNKHTIFGKIVGDTIFNLLKVNDLELDPSDRPLYPPKIIRVEIVWNPFDDIVPRVVQVEKKETPKAKGVKNLSLLSFDGDEFEDIPEIKTKSLHDTNKDPTLSRKPAVDLKHVNVRVTEEATDLKSKIKNILKKKESEVLETQESVNVEKQATIGDKPTKIVDTKKLEDEIKESTHFGRDYLANQKEKYKRGKRRVDQNESLMKIENFTKGLEKREDWKGKLKFSTEDKQENEMYEVFDPLTNPEKKVKF